MLQCVAVCEFEMLEFRSFDIERKRVGGMGGVRDFDRERERKRERERMKERERERV